MSKVKIMQELMSLIEKGEEVPFSLRQAARHNDINVDQLYNIMGDVHARREDEEDDDWPGRWGESRWD